MRQQGMNWKSEQYVREIADLSFTLSHAHFLQPVPRDGLVSCGTFPSLFVPPGSWLEVHWGRIWGKAPFDITWAAQPPSVETASRSLLFFHSLAFCTDPWTAPDPRVLVINVPCATFHPPLQKKTCKWVREPSDGDFLRVIMRRESNKEREKGSSGGMSSFLITLWGLRPSLVAILMWHNMMMTMGQFISSMHVLKPKLKLCGLWFSGARRLVQSQLRFTSVASYESLQSKKFLGQRIGQLVAFLWRNWHRGQVAVFTLLS